MLHFHMYPNTTPKRHLRRLIKHAYGLAPQAKQNLLAAVESTNATYPILAADFFWYTRKLWVKNNLQWYESLKIDEITISQTLLAAALPQTPEQLRLVFPTQKNRTKLYTTPLDSITDLAQIPPGDMLTEFSLIMPILLHNLYSHLDYMPLFLIERPLLYFNYFKFVLNYPKPPQKQYLKLEEILPRVYINRLKKFYTSYSTVEKLANFIHSKKRAKKYLRILAKRLTLYPKKKPKWRK